jgi:chorismate mutase / prephenate dehydrogenase
MTLGMTLEELRMKIDAINRELIELFGKRLELTKEVARVKKEKNLPVLDESREALQYEALRKLAKDRGLSPMIIEEVFRLFIDYSRLEMAIVMKEVEK